MTNLTDVVTGAMKAAGAGDADWRVQAGGAAVLVVAGLAVLGRRKIVSGIKSITQKRRSAKEKKL